MMTPMEDDDPRDPLFKGCTRPAMMFGVPLVPLAVVIGIVVLLSVWFSILIAFTLIPIVITMRIIAATDDQQFRLLWHKFWFRVINRNRNGKFWKASAYSPLVFTKRT
jgi:type IV secretion system protein VirB3